MPVTSSSLTADQGKWIAGQLVERSELIHKFPQFCNPVSLDQGMGKTANFTKVNRTDVPVDKLSEGVTPTETPFTIGTQSITVDQWGMFIALTDVGLVTTKHPILNEAVDLVADAIARVQDYTIAEVLNAGGNVQFWDGTRANRAALTSTDTVKAAVFNKARADMNDAGATPRESDLFIILCGPQIEADIINEASSNNSFFSVAQRQDKSKLEKGVVGDWLGFRIVRSNFIPKFTRLSTAGWTITPGAGGALAGTVYYKITQKSLARGFEENIAVEANNVMGGNNRIAFTAPATTGFVYNIYAGTATGDANLFLAKENLAAGASYNLDAVPASGVNPPATPPAGFTVHVGYVIGAKAIDNVELNGMSMKGTITPMQASDSDPLAQRRKVGSKYMSKSGIRNSFATKRIELASSF